MSQVVTLRFSEMPTLEVLLEEWHARGTIRQISATAVELCPAESADSVIVDYRRVERELLLQGSFCEATWSWVEQVRQRYHAILSEEEVGPDESKVRFEWQPLPWYWKSLTVAGAVVLLPILLPLCLLYALWQLGRLAFALRK